MISEGVTLMSFIIPGGAAAQAIRHWGRAQVYISSHVYV